MISTSWNRRGAIALAAAGSAFAGTLIGGSAATAGQAAEIPKNTSRPTISGAAREGETLRVSPGTWSGTQPMTFVYQWTRCSAQMSDCATIEGATNPEFKLTATDVGKRLIANVLVKNAGGGGTARATTETIGPRASGPEVASLPTIAGTPVTGQLLTAGPGTWRGSAPISFSYQWQRCDSAGNNCVGVAGATNPTFLLGSADVQHRLRVAATARNVVGSRSATSGPSALVVQAPPPGPQGQVKLPNGMTSIPVTSVSLPERLIVDRAAFAPSAVRSRVPFTATLRVVDTRGFAVRGALVFARSTPLVTRTPAEQETGQDGTVTIQIVPELSFPLRTGYNVQFFVRVRKPGDTMLAGVSTRRLVQVRTVAPATR